ncbi:MAG: hypothetical protein JSR33_05510 [Proteobacteria bacterium]|nr:hypothetical protein [Pseudomonadota bacterium]
MRNSSTFLPISNSTLSSSPMQASTNNMTSLLQGLMESKGWRDQREEFYIAEAKQRAFDQRLKLAIDRFLQKRNADSKTQLLEVLLEAREAAKNEYDNAQRQQAYYQEQAEHEAKEASSLSYLSGWSQWAFRNIKSFFGSTSTQLAEKYAKITKTRQNTFDSLSDYIDALKSKEREEMASCVESSYPFTSYDDLYLSSSKNNWLWLRYLNLDLSAINGTCGFTIADKQIENYQQLQCGCTDYETVGEDPAYQLPYDKLIIYGINISQEILDCIKEHYECDDGDPIYSPLIIPIIFGVAFIAAIGYCISQAGSGNQVQDIERPLLTPPPPDIKELKLLPPGSVQSSYVTSAVSSDFSARFSSSNSTSSYSSSSSEYSSSRSSSSFSSNSAPLDEKHKISQSSLEGEKDSFSSKKRRRNNDSNDSTNPQNFWLSSSPRFGITDSSVSSSFSPST